LAVFIRHFGLAAKKSFDLKIIKILKNLKKKLTFASIPLQQPIAKIELV